MPRDDDADLLLLEAIADHARLAIVRHLATHGPATATELTRLGDLGQSTVSHHLKVLREGGWVEAERRGSWIWYSLRVGAAERLRRLADSLRADGAAQLPPAADLPLPPDPRPGRRSLPAEDSWRQW